MRNRGTEVLFIIVIFLVFICGGVVYLIKFYLNSSPNFYALTALLLGVLILILFYDKIESVELDKLKIVIKQKEARKEFNKVGEDDHMVEIIKKRSGTSIKSIRVGDDF